MNEKIDDKVNNQDQDQSTRTFDANKIKDYYKGQIYERKEDNINTKFEDIIFPHNENSILSKDEKGEYTDPHIGKDRAKELDVSKYEWKRVDEIFSKDYKVFLDRIELADIIQGDIGNCYFLAALAALCEFPRLIYQIFRTKTLNSHGYFEVVLFIDGKWQVVTIDNYFVVKKGTNTLAFAQPNGKELWTIILEKAWAKVNGGYSNTIAGTPSEAFLALTGFSTERMTHDKTKKDQIWETLENYDRKNFLMCTGSKQKMPNKSNSLIPLHCYTLISAKKGMFKNELVKLVKLHNPWSNKEWDGKYCDTSPFWTKEKKEYFDFKGIKNEGTFFMEFDDFFDNFSDTSICYIMSKGNIKIFDLYNDQTETPQIFYFYISMACKVAISALFREWRFNRKLIDDHHPCSIILGSINSSNEIEYREGKFASNSNVNIVMDLSCGYYVAWIYLNQLNSNNKIKEYNIRFAIDDDYKILHLNYENAYSSNSVETYSVLKDIISKTFETKFTEGENYYEILSKFKSTGLGLLYVRVGKPFVQQEWDCEFASKGFDLLFPHNKKNNLKFICKSLKDEMVIGMRKKQIGEYHFNLKCKVKNIKIDENKNQDEEEEYQTQIIDETLRMKLIESKVFYDYKLQDLFNAVNINNNHEFDHELMLKHKEIFDEFEIIIQKFIESTETLKWIEHNYSEHEYYIGQINSKREREGLGKYKWETHEYVGYWKKNMKNGYGIYRYVDSFNLSQYEGEFLNGEKHGYGVLTYQNCDKYEGLFVKNKKEGKCKYTWSSGESWEGKAKNNVLVGNGVFYNCTGAIKTCEMKDGKLIRNKKD